MEDAIVSDAFQTPWSKKLALLRPLKTATAALRGLISCNYYLFIGIYVQIKWFSHQFRHLIDDGTMRPLLPSNSKDRPAPGKFPQSKRKGKNRGAYFTMKPSLFCGVIAIGTNCEEGDAQSLHPIHAARNTTTG